MKKLLLILLCLPVIGFGQQTYVPDDNFEFFLEAYGMGNGIANDDYVTTANINSITTLYIASQSISDLTGIEDFSALTDLDCRNNQLTTLDLSNNPALDTLVCYQNQLTSINVGANTSLTHLICSQNQLTTLDVSQNTALTLLDCSENQLTSIDVSNNPQLLTFWCNYNQITNLDISNNLQLIVFQCTGNQLTCLDISQNTILESLQCDNNLLEQLNTKNGNWLTMSVSASSNNLNCVEVDNIGFASNNWSFDSFTSISANCNYINPCNTTSVIQEHTSNKELFKVTELLGRKIKGKKNQPLLYIYDDGTVEKRITIDYQ